MHSELLQNNADDIVASRAIPRNVLEDFLHVAGIEPGACRRLMAGLEKLNGIPTPEQLGLLALDVIGIENVAQSLTMVLCTIRPDELHKYIESLHEWVESDKRRSEVFSEAVFSQLEENLSILFDRENTPVHLLQKAMRLPQVTGKQFLNAKIVCDLRPVFDQPGSEVAGFVIVNTLRLNFQSEQSEESSIEVIVSDSAISQLRADLQRAEQKIQSLRRLRNSFGVSPEEDE